MNISPEPSVIQDLIHGQCNDPFAVLGLHATSSGFVVRTLQPGASSAAIIDSAGATLAMNSIDAAGLFELALPENPGDYEFEFKK